ncbi:MAG: adenylate kinase [Thermoplasmata archaeon]
MRSVVTGVAGVGKTTVLDIVSKKSGFAIVNYGTVMFDVAKERKLANDRDEMRKLAPDIQVELQRLAANKIGSMDNILIDTHMSIKTPRGYLPGLPEWVLRELKASLYVIIEANPEIIKKRRDNDPTRKRDEDSESDIDEHQRMNRYFAAAYSIFTGATVLFVKNEEGKPEEAADHILKVLAND